MLRKHSVLVGLLAVTFGIGFLAGRDARVTAQAKNRVFEIRIATTPNRQTLDVLVDRFRQGEVKLFEKAGMKGIGFWLPVDPPKSENTFIYILAHESLEGAKASWAKFRADPEFRALVERIPAPPGPRITVESIFSEPVDFSPIK